MFVGRDDNVTLSQREREIIITTERERDITTEREIIITTERERERERLQQRDYNR